MKNLERKCFYINHVLINTTEHRLFIRQLNEDYSISTAQKMKFSIKDLGIQMGQKQ